MTQHQSGNPFVWEQPVSASSSVLYCPNVPLYLQYVFPLGACVEHKVLGAQWFKLMVGHDLYDFETPVLVQLYY